MPIIKRLKDEELSTLPVQEQILHLALRIRKLEAGSNAFKNDERDHKVDIDDPKWGDPPVWEDPPRWTGESFAKKRMSQCTPEYLDNLAEFLVAKAIRNERTGRKLPDGKTSLGWMNRRDAAKAKAWAARLREQSGEPAKVDDEDPFGDIS